ncbi:lipopolysaccharide assembly protein LapA domain-containing protein [Haliea sp. E17]|uniref:lipopolysaccharide assembly protein LapA domain-containing protein n=1 Tax=Haliea sp. E17 TaxID=3401576 RepID=UPI003AAE195E
MTFLRKILLLVVLLAMLSVGVLFAVQNEVLVPLDLLVYRFEAHSLALWLLLAFALGGIFGLLASSLILLRQRTSLGSTRRQLNQARAEVDRLRTAGLQSGE